MNAMMAAFNKASEADPDMKRLVMDAKKLHNCKVREEKEERQKMIAARDAAILEEHLRETEKAIEENRKKQIWEWVARPADYTFDCGIVFADTEEEARSIIAGWYRPSTNIKIKLCDCSRNAILIMSHYE